MIIEYDVHCHERTLTITFPNGYEHLKKAIIKMLDEYYDYWHDAENIEDDEERTYVMDVCLEDYMMDKLSETYNMWEEWESIYYGDNEEEMCETEPYVNPELLARRKLSRDLRGAELIIDREDK